MKTTMAGPAGTVHAGQVCDLPDFTAYDLIERGYAEQVGFAPPKPQAIETAAIMQPETTAMPAAAKRLAAKVKR
jgi:hypothetical protein